MPPVSFNVTLSSPPAGGVVGGSPGVGTIYPGTVPGPSVSSVSSVSGNEGTSLVHTVTLSAATTASTDYAYSLGGGTSTSVSDYTVPPTFSAGVTLSGGTLTVPSGVSSFTVTVAALTDGATEGSETYNLTVGGVTGVGTISDSGASLITPSGTASRSSGAAPLAVHFDLSATTAAGYTTKPFHHLEYITDFGDGSSGTWDNGILSGTLSRNTAHGAIAMHVYADAGTYNPSTVIRWRNSDGSYDSTTYNWPAVTVTAADTQWAGSKTHTYSLTDDHTGAPDGSVHHDFVTDIAAAIEANAAADRRHLLHAGQTFPELTNFEVIVNGPGLVGRFGTGADPIIQRGANHVMVNISRSTTPKTVNDWRFCNIVFDGNGYDNLGFYGAGSFTQVLLYQCEVKDISWGVQLSASVLNGLNAITPIGDPAHHDLWDEFYVVDSTVTDITGDNASGHNGFILSGRRIGIVGNMIDPLGGGEHGLRAQLSERSVYQHNTIQNIAAGKTNMTLRGGEFNGDATIPAGEYSEKLIISWNHFIGGLSGGMCGDGPQYSGARERGRNHVWEYNHYEGSTANTSAQSIAQPDCTYRYNVITIGSGSFLKIEKNIDIPAPTGLEVYGNSLYTPQTGYFSLVNCAPGVGAGGEEVSAGFIDVFMANNLVHTPNITGGDMFQNTYGSGTLTAPAGTNTTDAQLEANTSANFTTVPPTAPAHFKPTTGYAIGAGHKTSGAYVDILRVAVPSTPDIGAVVH